MSIADTFFTEYLTSMSRTASIPAGDKGLKRVRG